MTISVTYWVIKVVKPTSNETAWITHNGDDFIAMPDKKDAMPFLTEWHARLVMNSLEKKFSKGGEIWSLDKLQSRERTLDGAGWN